MDKFDFLQVFPLVHKVSYESVYSKEQRTQFAIDALAIMDRFGALHPLAAHLVKFLHQSGSLASSKYNSWWLADIGKAATVSEYFLQPDFPSAPEKSVLFDEFVPLFQKLFIEGDFKILAYYITKMGSMVQFLNHSTNPELFVDNKYFEYMLFQVISTVYGLMSRFSSFSSMSASSEANEEEKRMLLEKKISLYHTRSLHLLKSLQDLNSNDKGRVECEFECYKVSKFLLAMSKFKKNQFFAFVEDFDELYPMFDSVGPLNLQPEFLIMYSVASLACKPFKDLSFATNEALVERYRSSLDVVATFYDMMCGLANAEFDKAKSLMNNSLLEAADSVIEYLLPLRPEGFWTYLGNIIDLKIFLLTMSVTRKIPRSAMVKRLGYRQCSPAEYSRVSDNLLVLMSVLQLGKVNITFDQENDEFRHDPLEDDARLDHLVQRIDQMDHTTRAEASAQLLRAKLVETYLGP